MMIKDLDKVFRTLNGQKMTFQTPKDEPGSVGGNKMETRDLTIREAVVNSLLSTNQRETILGIEKARRYSLAMKVYQAKKQVELTVEDVTLIKDEIGRIYPPLVVGQAYEFLDPPKGE